MQYVLRFQLYDNPSRQSFSQLGTDKLVTKYPLFRYGLVYRVDDDNLIDNQLPVYVVANITRIKHIPDPTNPGINALLFEVFLARLEEWGQFDEADEVKQVRESYWPTYNRKLVRKRPLV
ncbi:hypothetical protein EXU85_24760 [Spirosoma sp. KCTC 42546]|uniref:hypothetical protein n=1 Tax=Spirosoma sp. KCTC 42546 TaxID=2520506 RepID=UPI00115C3080|nr:hypothetical protein [Spirosoma sp. KCTC 42546]QDK81647.1 hypothetical protein EXU85_24760 [Spirosoma sp. KCTC 42546]